ncbi:HGL102Wp [Eremothecium sinecaudum]|uniref:HGL102Wp n=1 Tax=Eremothecium sinecaudum TaxID=45286 RepID=A0A0X8HVL8_9SACH|nr:HGL102Wp [Eremothecium sinecaudum]AMD22238.1 HGL102Wp [Eremothecium sinecaudum]
MMPVKLRKKQVMVLGTIFFFVCTFLLSVHPSNDGNRHFSSRIQSGFESVFNSANEIVVTSTWLGNGNDPYYVKVLEGLKRYRPLDRPEDPSIFKSEALCEIYHLSSHDGKDSKVQSYENLYNCFNVPEQLMAELKIQHSGFISFISSHLKPSESAFKRLFPRGKGIVTVGGSSRSILAFTMIKTLRERGTTLPVEVFIPSYEGRDDQFCKRIKSMNAICIDEKPIFGDSKEKIEPQQANAIALLVSSFKEVLFIEAGNIPLKDLDQVFNSKAYKENGLVLWPDISTRTTSPSFYEMAGISVDFTKRIRYYSDDVNPPYMYTDMESDDIEQFNKKEVPFHDLAGTVPNYSTASGQLIVNKNTHLKTLLLSLYYNIYGNDWFYEMFSQKSNSEAHKETYILAAHALMQPYYQVKTLPTYEAEKKQDYKSILLHRNFRQDYERWRNAKKEVKHKHGSKKNKNKLMELKPNYSFEKHFVKAYMEPPDEERIDIMFIHSSLHELVPSDILKSDVPIDDTGKNFRSFKSLKLINNFDFEYFTYETLQEYICDEDRIEFDYLRNKLGSEFGSYDAVCEYIERRVQMLKDTHDEVIGVVKKYTN